MDKLIHIKPLQFKDPFKVDLQGEGPSTWGYKYPPAWSSQPGGPK